MKRNISSFEEFIGESIEPNEERIQEFKDYFNTRYSYISHSLSDREIIEFINQPYVRNKSIAQMADLFQDYLLSQGLADDVMESKVNEAIVDEERLSKKMIEILNKQIKNELDSSQMYRAMSCWLDDQKWPSSVKVFFEYADEELTHMTKIYQYLFDRNCKVTVPTCDEQKGEFKDIKEMVEIALEHEISVTKNWEEISKLAKDEDDSTTFEFAQWFLREQIEEEDKLRTIIEKIDLEMPKYEIDNYIGTL